MAALLIMSYSGIIFGWDFERFALFFAKNLYAGEKKISCKNTIIYWIVPKMYTENGEFLAKIGPLKFLAKMIPAYIS